MLELLESRARKVHMFEMFDFEIAEQLYWTRAWDKGNPFLLLLGDAGAPGHPGPKGEPGESISAPGVIVSPASLTVTQHQTATFYCSADGNPKPSVSWSKKSGAGLVNTDGQDNKLQIRSAVYNDSGSYVCTVTNVLGQVQKVVKLFVEGKLSLGGKIYEG